MQTSKILIIGDGLLGTELQKQLQCDIVSRTKDGFDITNVDTYHTLLKVEFGVAQWCPYDIVINCVANTDTYSEDRDDHWNVNYAGVANLVEHCNRWKVKLIHISTDHLYSNSNDYATENDVPVHCNNWYGYTKLLGDAHVQLKADNYAVIRTTHKKTPYQHSHAWQDQIGNFDYVDKIGKLIIELINTNPRGIYNIGTETKTMYQLAKATSEAVRPNFVKEGSSTPTDVTMNTSKMIRRISESSDE